MVRVFFFIAHSSEHNAADTKEGTDENDKVFFLIRKEFFFKKGVGGVDIYDSNVRYHLFYQLCSA